MSKITIVDYGMGNLGSIVNMIKKIGHESIITNDPDIIESSQKIILPGVGNFDAAMSRLEELKIIQTLKNFGERCKPILGICLGMQLLADSSQEGKSAGLGLIPGEVKKFMLSSKFKIPHMGWNNVSFSKKSILFENFDNLKETRFYFVHSYHYVCKDQKSIIGRTHYEKDFTSSINLNNIYGVQFHPEKSHKFGMLLLKNFIEKIF